MGLVLEIWRYFPSKNLSLIHHAKISLSRSYFIIYSLRICFRKYKNTFAYFIVPWHWKALLVGMFPIRVTSHGNRGVENDWQIDCLLKNLVQTTNKGNRTGDQWSPVSKGQYCGKLFHGITSASSWKSRAGSSRIHKECHACCCWISPTTSRWEPPTLTMTLC